MDITIKPAAIIQKERDGRTIEFAVMLAIGKK